MRIKRMKWWNYKGLGDGEIVADGRDVIISGRNGSGKSSIAELMTFVLKGKYSGSVRQYETGREVLSGMMHGAAIEFDSGETFTREITESGSILNSTRLYINGQKVSAGGYALRVNELTRGGDEYLINPNTFPNLSAKKQRDYLISMYLSGRGNIEASMQVAESTAALQRLKKKMERNEALLDEHRKAMEDMPADLAGEMARIEAELVKAHEYLIQTSGRMLEAARSEEKSARVEYESVKARLDSDKAYFTELSDRYKGVATACPMCGAPMPLAKIKAARAEIAAKGRLVKARIMEGQSRLEEIAVRISAAVKAVSEAQGSAETREAAKAKVTELQGIHSELKNLEVAAAKVAEYEAAQEAMLAKKLELEAAKATAQRYQAEQIEAAESSIAGEFELIRFKLWDVRATGEVYDTCEVLLGDVPYRALSTGEQWQANLAIVKGLQGRYGVELPLMIDNAEGLTANTAIEMPNQKFFFRACESDLVIEVCDG